MYFCSPQGRRPPAFSNKQTSKCWGQGARFSRNGPATQPFMWVVLSRKTSMCCHASLPLRFTNTSQAPMAFARPMIPPPTDIPAKFGWKLGRCRAPVGRGCPNSSQSLPMLGRCPWAPGQIWLHSGPIWWIPGQVWSMLADSGAFPGQFWSKLTDSGGLCRRTHCSHPPLRSAAGCRVRSRSVPLLAEFLGASGVQRKEMPQGRSHGRTGESSDHCFIRMNLVRCCSARFARGTALCHACTLRGHRPMRATRRRARCTPPLEGAQGTCPISDHVCDKHSKNSIVLYAAQRAL